MKNAVITGANGGLGFEITKAVSKAGYHVIMACRDIDDAEVKKEQLLKDDKTLSIEVLYIDLSKLKSVAAFIQTLTDRGLKIDLLMNNAGQISTHFEQTEDGLEKTICTNYVGPYLLTRKLIPLMNRGARIVNMISCTYILGKLSFPDFFTHGKTGRFWRLPIYSNTKLALLLFTFELAEFLADKGIRVNAVDPGIVSTNMISMKTWLDPLADIFFRPFIRTPLKGASTAIDLLLSEAYNGVSGKLFASNREKKVADKYLNHPLKKELWEETEKILMHYSL